jgi:uncharacterized protein YbjT (DUF2867 family)
MRKVIVIGANGSLATYVVQEIQKLTDVHQTLFVRKKNRLTKSHLPNTTIIEGDVLDYSKLKETIMGQDIVYVNLAGDLEAMARNIVKAMKEVGVKRIIAISSIGIYNEPVKPVLIPYRKLADVIEASGLEYTILRPDWFTSSNEIDYALTHKGEPETGSAISRRSIASFVAGIIENPDLYKKSNLGISKP